MNEEVIRARVTVTSKDVNAVIDELLKAMPTGLMLQLAIRSAADIPEGERENHAEMYYLGLLLAVADRLPDAVRALLQVAGAEGERVEPENGLRDET